MRVEALGHDCRQPRPADRPAETLGHLQLSIESSRRRFYYSETSKGDSRHPHPVRRLPAAKTPLLRVACAVVGALSDDRRPRIECKRQSDNPR